MGEPKEPKPEHSAEQPASRNREEVLRDIRLALAIDGLALDERRRKARGFNPYDSGPGSGARDPWKGRRRG